ncbi:DUF6455 family protein [Primorskyibacter sp. S187A]|uniref:DUF6455 family protein n=1 Tax=Primorskyibacter sp. S187A TaxID=3415130 RepID=UPI003C79B8CE
MATTNQFKKHAALVDHMAQSMGVDLEEKVLRGDLDPAELVDAVLSCTNCTNPEACAQHLAERRGLQATTPGYCRNTKLFETLQDGA